MNLILLVFQNVLLDLLGGSPVHTTSSDATSRGGLAPVPVASTGNNMDLLDLLGGIGDPSPVMSSNDTNINNNGGMNILDAFGGLDTKAPVMGNNGGGGGLLDNSLFGGVGGMNSSVGFMNTNNNSNSNSTTQNHSSLIGGLLDDLSLGGGGLVATEPEGEVGNELISLMRNCY